jgi:hypothetical protein
MLLSSNRVLNDSLSMSVAISTSSIPNSDAPSSMASGRKAARPALRSS